MMATFSGNADGKGNIRKEEFYRACAILKVYILSVQGDRLVILYFFRQSWAALFFLSYMFVFYLIGSTPTSSNSQPSKVASEHLINKHPTK